MTLTTATVISPRFYASIIPTCKSLKAVQTVHAHAFKYGLDSDPLVAGNLLLRCAVGLLNALDYAQRLLFETPDPDPFMYNTLIRGYSESDSPHHSISTFSLLIKDLGRDAVDSFSLAFSMKAAANMRCLSTGFQLHCQAMGRGFTGNLFVGTTLVSLYGECGSLGCAEKVFDEIPERSVVTWNALVTSFARCGDMEGAEKVFNDMKVRDLASSNIMIAGYVGAGEFDSARRVFEEMPERDEVSWSTLISGFVGYGRLDEAFGCFRELVRDGMKVNEVGLTAVLSACAQAGAMVFANVLHGLIEKLGLVWITTVNNALIDAYAKCGSIDMARLVFDRVPGEKSIISWTSMLVALASQGYGEDALTLFHKMEKSGIELDGIAFIVMLYACSHSGLVEQGCEIFEKMTTVYNIKPEIEHYGCMVDLHGRAGQLSKAYDFASQMPIQPTAVIWRTLLGACSFHGNVRLAEQVSKRLAELDPSHCGDHVLLSNIYAVAKKWKDVASVRKSMTQMRITKSPGWSMIEVDKVMYTFVAGAKQDNSVTKEAFEKLKGIMLKLRREGGYVPEIVDVFHDVEEEEKEDAIVTHSEKLAVAFGLSRLAESNDVVVIRIVKNLRVCRDCHSVMKSISKVYGVQIVLRDRSRFHSFSNGICSCRDYW